MHGSDARFLRHKCPIFYKYVICASGINEAKKNELRRLVESEGGTYRGDLLCGTTTHLVCNEAKGVKYDHARLWKITVIKPQWIHDCIGAGYCLPEKNYLIESENQQTSTPTAAAAAAKQAASSTGGGGGGATGGGAGGGANGAKRANALDNIDVSVIAGVSSARGAANLTATAGMLNRSSAMASRLVNETESGSGNNNMRANHNNSTFSSPSLPPPQSALPHSAHKNNAAGGGGGLLLSSKQQSMQMPMSSYADLEKELNQIGKIKLTLFDGIGVGVLLRPLRTRTNLYISFTNVCVVVVVDLFGECQRLREREAQAHMQLGRRHPLRRVQLGRHARHRQPAQRQAMQVVH